MAKATHKTASSERSSMIGTTVATLISSALLCVPQTAQTRSIAQVFAPDDEKGPGSIREIATAAATKLNSLATSSTEHVTMLTMLNIITKHGQLKGLIMNDNSVFVTTGEHREDRTLSEYPVHMRVYVREFDLQKLRTELGQFAKQIPASGNKVYVSLKALKKAIKATQQMT